MDLLAHYVRIHLTGAAAGIELFGRGSSLADATARETVAAIREELFGERDWLRGLAERLGTGEPTLARPLALVGERVGRLKPNGDLLHRTPLTDVVDLEAMHDAVSGKIAGWRALRQADDLRVPRSEVSGLLEQALRQRDDLSVLHEAAARRAFSG
jgi:hypothetical protein